MSYWINPAEKLVTRALNKWRAKLMKADNISCIVVLIDPLGPSKLTLLRKRREENFAAKALENKVRYIVFIVGDKGKTGAMVLEFFLNVWCFQAGP